MVSVSEIIPFLEEKLGKLGSPMSQYKKVIFSPVFWTNSDIPVENDISTLNATFRKRLGADVIECKLENNPKMVKSSVHSYLAAVMADDLEDCLIIFYVTAHGGKVRESTSVTLYKNNQGNCPKLEMNWFVTQIEENLLESSDVLLFLDFCHSALVMKGREERRLELIAACGIDEVVPHGEFAKALNHEINNLRNSTLVVSLHQKLVARIRHTYQATPVYGMLRGENSIRLTPKEFITEEILSEPRLPVPHALVQIHLKEDLNDEQVSSFARRLGSIIQESLDTVGSIDVIKSFKTQSTVIYLVMPLALADLLCHVFDIKIMEIHLISSN